MATELTKAIGHDTPLRLDVAAKIAFPRGGMTVTGLRREARRGRLIIERVAGKDYTTLNHIAGMRQQCQLQPNLPDCGSVQHGEIKQALSLMRQTGSSSIEAANTALAATLKTLGERKRP